MKPRRNEPKVSLKPEYPERSRAAAIAFFSLFLCGLLAAGLSLSQIVAFGGESQAEASGRLTSPSLVRAESYPAPVITPEEYASDIVLRGFEGLSDTLAQPTDTPRERRILTHIVQPNDTVFGIALQYGLTPETVLWSNYTTLKDNPDLLSLGQELRIPPGDGLVYIVEPGDTVESVARRFRVEPDAVAGDAINGLSSVDQALQSGQTLFVPGGEREVVVWQLSKPVEVRRTLKGVPVYRVGNCGEVEIPQLGRGDFVFPTNRQYLSGYTFGPSHGGWDLAGRLGEPIYASDGGTVVYAGYSLDSRGRPRGYGQYVVLDHGNGYQTLYAHASQLYVSCGQQVRRGAVIAAVGSVGKSTGPHLHFEIRLKGSYVDPAQFMTLTR
jgi:murein DD-endopeptidase MepM/ murein hydrolase activator NlpD